MGAHDPARAVLGRTAAFLLAGSFALPAAAHDAPSQTDRAPEPDPSTYWFSAVVRVRNAPVYRPVTICATNQHLTWTDGRNSGTVAVPDSTVSFKPWETQGSTNYGGVWDTSVPAVMGPSRDAFLSALAIPVPKNGRDPVKVTWSATIATDTPNVVVHLKWRTRTYTKFLRDYNELEVVPFEDPRDPSKRAGLARKMRTAMVYKADDGTFTAPGSGNKLVLATYDRGCGGVY